MTHRFGLTTFCIVALLPVLLGFAPAQEISYMLPDVGSPGMNIYVEFVAPHDAPGNFGSDGFFLNHADDDTRLECADPADTGVVKIGPFVVSWSGRLVSAQLFIHPDVSPTSSDWEAVGAAFRIPIRFVRNGTPSNTQTFYIVRPQPAIVSSADGTLGSGGSWGQRSPRGAMIVDSLILSGSNYSVSVGDPDAAAPGNQGYLPAVIISRGPVRTASNTLLQVDANGKHAGPGGGGGGGNFCDFTGDGSDGGDGFTGGGPGGRNRAGNPFSSDEYRNPGTGSGDFIGMTGGSLNGIRGGNAPAYEASGGGTGHPFGTSGEGCNSGSNCDPPGGYGGGSGQRQLQNGGGAGYATDGASSNLGNGGKTHGNEFIVPLAGGSGGGGGNPQQGFACSGDGGGGGGALRLFAPEMSTYLVTSNGAGGRDGSSADGGGGSGGAVSMETKLLSSVWKISAVGGSGVGSIGGAGRIRMDGPLGWTSSGMPVDESLFVGPSTDTTMFVRKTFTLTGTGNGEAVHLFLRSDREPWTEIAVINGYGTSWSHDITFEGEEGLYYLAALQSVPDPSSNQFASRPQFVMSQAAANIFWFSTRPELVADIARTLPDLLCEDESFDTLLVRNDGDGTLVIAEAAFVRGDQGYELLTPAAFPVFIAPEEEEVFIVRSRRVPGQTGLKTDSLYLINNSPGGSPHYIAFSQQVDLAEFLASVETLVFPTVLICDDTSSAVASFLLTNTGSIPLTIPAPFNVGPEYTVIAPASFPIVLNPGDDVSIRLRVTHVTTGAFTNLLRFRIDLGDCLIDEEVTLESDAWEPDVTLAPVAEGRVQCPGDMVSLATFIFNNSDGTVQITGISTDNPAFTITSPMPPFSLAPQEGRDVEIVFQPAMAGATNARLIVESEPCGQQLETALTGYLDSLLLVADALDFGMVRASTLPMTAMATLRNAGLIDITITSASSAGPFRIISGLPVTIPAGGSADVEVEFEDTMQDGDYSEELELMHTPSCGPVMLQVNGRRATARVVLIADTLSAEPSNVIDVLLYLRNAENMQLFGATGIRATLRYHKSLLVPQFEPAGSIVGDERVIELDIPLTTDANNVAMRLPFMVTLGTEEEGQLLLTDVQSIGGDLTVDVEQGYFTLLGVCREGGTRLFDADGQIALRPNHPNPFNPRTEIVFEVLEAAHTVLYVVDGLGRRVATLVDAVLRPGVHSATFDASTLPSGFYISVLQTPTVIKTRRMLLAK